MVEFCHCLAVEKYNSGIATTTSVDGWKNIYFLKQNYSKTVANLWSISHDIANAEPLLNIMRA